MNLGFEYMFVIVAFIAIIVMSSYGSAVVPYQKDDLFSKQFVYEGLDDPENPEDPEEPDNPKKPKVISSEGMQTFQPYTIAQSEMPLDTMSQLPGSKTCDINSAIGYANSMGPLCIDENTMQLLRTRGGNQPNVPFQIGQ